jgi:hypothetical protein
MSRLRGRKETNSQMLVRISMGREGKAIAGEQICSSAEMANDWGIVTDRGFLSSGNVVPLGMMIKEWKRLPCY